MAKTPIEVQEAQAESHQDIEHSDESLDDLRSLLYPDRVGLYDGAGALTAKEIQETLNLNTHEGARSRAQRAARAGALIEVKVLRMKANGGEYVTTAWVKKADYDAWEQDNDK